MASLTHPWYIRFWQRMTLWSMTVEGEMVWWCGDDDHHRTRKLDFEIRWPRWVFRPICWLIKDGHGEHYGCCVICEKPMSKRR